MAAFFPESNGDFSRLAVDRVSLVPLSFSLSLSFLDLEWHTAMRCFAYGMDSRGPPKDRGQLLLESLERTLQLIISIIQKHIEIILKPHLKMRLLVNLV